MDILQRILSGQHEAVPDQGVLDHYQQVAQAAPPEVLAQVQEDALKQLSPDERQQLLDQFRQAHNDPNQSFTFPGFDHSRISATPAHLRSMMALAQQQQPDLLQNMLSGGNGNPAMKALMAAVIGMVMQQMLGGGASANTGQMGGGLLGSILGQMMGGRNQGGDNASQGQADDQPNAGGGLGDILGQVLGGGKGGGLGSILGQLGGAGGGLGDVLGQTAGGGSSGTSTDNARDSENPLDLPADSGIEVEQTSEGDQPQKRS
jgi:hypothetical protein